MVHRTTLHSLQKSFQLDKLNKILLHWKTILQDKVHKEFQNYSLRNLQNKIHKYKLLLLLLQFLMDKVDIVHLYENRNQLDKYHKYP